MPKKLTNRTLPHDAQRVRFLRRLKWSAVVLPALFTLWSETVRHRFFDDAPPLLGNLITATLAFLSALVFAHIIFHYIEILDADLLAQNHRLATLHDFATAMNEPGDEAALLARSLPIIRDALRVTGVDFDVAERPATRGDGMYRHMLRHNGLTLGALTLVGVSEPFDAALFVSIGDTLAVALANRRLAAENARVAVLEERDRIARELHDGLAQMLAAITLQSARVRVSLADGNALAVRVAADRIEEASSTAYEDVREAIVGLRVGVGTDFLSALRQTTDRFEDATGIVVTLHGANFPCGVTPTAELQLLRVMQECLTNVRKHAHATAVEIRVVASDKGVEVTVHDNGSGFDPGAVPRGGRHHFGLLIMRERIDSLGGRLVVCSAPGDGTTIRVAIPASMAQVRGAA